MPLNFSGFIVEVDKPPDDELQHLLSEVKHLNSYDRSMVPCPSGDENKISFIIATTSEFNKNHLADDIKAIFKREIEPKNFSSASATEKERKAMRTARRCAYEDRI